MGESGEIEAARDRHLAYYAAFAEHDRGLDGEHAAWMTKVGLDHDNLEAALEWALSADDVGPAVALAVALAPYWLLRGHLRRGRDWATRVLERTQPDDAQRGWALWLHAALGGYGGSIETIQTTCPEALVIARACRDSSLAARCLSLR